MRFFRRRSIIWTVFSTFIGIFAFLVLLAALNYFITPEHVILRGLVTLLNDNLPYFIVIALLLMTGEIFDHFTFPLNLPAPLFHALASVFLVLLVFNVFQFLDAITRAGIYGKLEILRILLSILIFLIVFTGGYFKIFGDLLRVSRQREVHGEPVAQASPHDTKTWDDIGNEFRQLIFDVLQRMRDEIRENDDD
ncbi:MAG TPA: hypothetical protein VMB35_09430 [Methanomicrobiales archaeon]|nr:hypothetical protein [Methanomicrobiales archaeon]